jgi:hypothetical protein
MSGPWQQFIDELARWRDGGRKVSFWWRDDDAARADPAVDLLLSLSERTAVPLALAVIPLRADPAMLAALGDTVSVLQHGTDHENRAGPGHKKTEFPASEADTAAMARLREAQARLAAARHFIPVLAPPWNRIRRELVPRLPAAGLRGLSQYGARSSAQPVPGLLQVNTHVDIIAWQGGRRFAGEDAVLGLATAHLEAKRSGHADAEEPTGWLTHHACHDAPAWTFLERLFETTQAMQGIRWLGAQEIFHA